MRDSGSSRATPAAPTSFGRPIRGGEFGSARAWFGPKAAVAKGPSHSHSIVSGTYNPLKDKHFVSGLSKFTVIRTVRKFRLRAIDAERIYLSAGPVGSILANTLQILIEPSTKVRPAHPAPAIQSPYQCVGADRRAPSYRTQRGTCADAQHRRVSAARSI